MSIISNYKHYALGVCIGIISPALSWAKTPLTPQELAIESFEKEIVSLQQVLKVPGFSMAIVQDGKTLLSKGYGWADIEKKHLAESRTPYPTASLTKTFTATLLMQLVQEGKISLDDDMAKYVTEYQGTAVKVGHIASHTSEGTPGDDYKYNHGRFAQLAPVLQKVTGQTYQQLLTERILEPLHMTSTVLGADPIDWIRSQKEAFNSWKAARYMTLLEKMATSYRLDASLNPVPYNSTLGGISAAGGLISTVEDMAKYYSAMDDHRFISAELQQKMFSPIIANDGRTFPYGLGWFIFQSSMTKVVWHYGYIAGMCSSIVIKVPDQKLTLILLANSDGFSAPFDGLIDGQVLSSPVALSFIRHFVVLPKPFAPMSPDWAVLQPDVQSQTESFERSESLYCYDSERSASQKIKTWFINRQAK